MVNTSSNQAQLNRLTALWALSESGLGGFMHALKIPFTGFFLGGFAIVIITLIAHQSVHKYKAILQATLLVILVKAVASPHSPPMAYIAVGFQGLAGLTFFSLIPNLRLAAILFGFIGLMESAVQKFLVMTLLFGKSIWEALDLFVQSILKDLSFMTNFSFSFWLIAGYIGVYSIWGILVGLWAGSLPQQLAHQSDAVILQWHNLPPASNQTDSMKKRKRTGKLIGGFFMLVFMASVFLFQGLGGKAMYAIIRALAALVLLFYVINPLIKWGIARWSKKQQANNKKQLTELLDLLPSISSKVAPAMQIARIQNNGLSVYPAFVINLIILSLYLTPIHE
jgi:hypothetical protein